MLKGYSVCTNSHNNKISLSKCSLLIPTLCCEYTKYAKLTLNGTSYHQNCNKKSNPTTWLYLNNQCILQLRVLEVTVIFRLSFKAYCYIYCCPFKRLQSSVNVLPLTVTDKLKYIEGCQLTTDHNLSCLDMLHVSKEFRHLYLSSNISNVS